jgi:hypothetical protein
MKRSCAREEVLPLKRTIGFSIPRGEGSVASLKLPVDPIRASDRLFQAEEAQLELRAKSFQMMHAH